MSSNQDALQKLFQDYYIMGVHQFILALQARIEPDAEVMDIVSDAGYEWDEQIVMFNDHKMGQQIAVLPNDMFIWIYNGHFGKILKNKEKLALWIGGRGADFIAKFDKTTGGITPPDSATGNSAEKDLGIAPSTKATDTDILIGKLYRQAGKNKTLPANLMIDLGKRAKQDNDTKLLQFLKTMKPMHEGTIKRSQLKAIIGEIIKTILAEGVMTNPALDDATVAEKIIKKKFGKGETWYLTRSRDTEFGKVFSFEATHTRNKVLIWKTTEGVWKIFNNETRKWADVDMSPAKKAPVVKTGNPSENVAEETATGAVGPISTPFAFKKTKGMKEGDEADAMNDMNSDAEADHYDKNYGIGSQKSSSKTIQLTATGGEDDWSRPIYRDQNGRIYVDINCGSGTPSIHTISDEGEPEYPVRNYKITPSTPLKEETSTGDISGYNIPGAFAKKGGSKKGVEGSESLGYTLTAIGKKDMEKSGDKIHEGKNIKDGDAICRHCHKGLRYAGQITCHHCGKTQKNPASGEASHAKKFANIPKQ